jgi:hypothetical protein
LGCRSHSPVHEEQLQHRPVSLGKTGVPSHSSRGSRRFFYPFVWQQPHPASPPVCRCDRRANHSPNAGLTSCTGRLLEHAGLLKRRNAAPADRHFFVWRATATPRLPLPRARIALQGCHINPPEPSRPGSKITKRSIHCFATRPRRQRRFSSSRLSLIRWLGPFHCNPPS